jgi:uncharacterized membrane protein required for colicin V production
MNWLDILVIIMIVAATALEAIRGFGRAIFDALAIYGVLWLASTAAAPVAHIMPIGKDSGINLAFGYCLVAVLGSIVGLVIAHFCYAATLPHAGMFDTFFGLALGVGVGLMFCHCLVRGIAFSDPNGDGSGALVSTGVVSSEVYDFHSCHSIVDSITGAASYHRELPNVN